LKQNNWIEAQKYLNNAIQYFLNLIEEHADPKYSINQIFLLTLIQFAYIDLKLEKNTLLSEALMQRANEYSLSDHSDIVAEASSNYSEGSDTFTTWFENQKLDSSQGKGMIIQDKGQQS
jgi:hypothetical protein